MGVPIYFYNLLIISLIKVRALNYKFPVEERDTASIIIDHSGPPPDMYDVQVNHRVLICIMYKLTIEYNYVRCTGKP